MADSTLVGLTGGTPVASDVMYFVGDPGGTAVDRKVTVSALLAVAQGGAKNALDADTGITGDGVTDDAAAIDTLLTAGGDIYFPAGDYFTGTTVITAKPSVDLRVICAPRARFIAGLVDGNMFSWDTNDGTKLHTFEWYGGQVIGSAMHTSRASGGRRDEGLLRDSYTADTTDLFSFRDGYWSKIVVSGVQFTCSSVGADALETDPRDVAHHWMGQTDGSTVGADSAIFCNSGAIEVRDCMFVGFRDTAIYLAGTGNHHGSSIVDSCKFYWCVESFSAKGGALNGTVSNCYSYRVFKSYQFPRSSSGVGGSGWDLTDCISELCFEGLQLKQASDVNVSGFTFRDGGYVDWNGRTDFADGEVVLSAGSGTDSVDGITVDIGAGAVQIMSGAESFDTDLRTWAENIRDNINAQGVYLASVRADLSTNGAYSVSGAWEIRIHNIAAVDADGATVARTITDNGGGVTATPGDMAESWGQPTAVLVDGAQNCSMDGIRIVGTDPVWEAARASERVRAFDIRSIDSTDSTFGGADFLTLDLTINDVVVDGIREIGGEYASNPSGAAVPNRTRVNGVVHGDDLDLYDGFILLGQDSSVDYGYERTVILDTGSDSTTIASTSSASLTWTTSKVYLDAIYEVEADLIIDGPTADDLRIGCTDPGATSGGYFSLIGPASGAGSNSGDGIWQASLWSGLISFGTPGTGGGTAIISVKLQGILKPVATGDFYLRWRLNANTGPAKMYDFSKFRIKRIG